MKKVTLLFVSIIILCFVLSFVGASYGSDGSYYDVLWDITVTDCQGKVTVYKNCTIIRMNEQWITFVPNSSRVSTGSGKRKLLPVGADCLIVMMDEQ